MEQWDWGTVPTWFSALLTGGSLLLGFYILLRDRRKEEQEEARKLVCHAETWATDDGTQVRLWAQNTSDRPFLYVWPMICTVHTRPGGVWTMRTRGGQTDEHAVADADAGPLMPGERLLRTWLEPDEEELVRSPARLSVVFKDSDGIEWVRVLPDQRLVRTSVAFRKMTVMRAIRARLRGLRLR
ncbi:hypothetical protein HW130_17345 [Streptomyces sp. PKU-EA00015]|uniref:hypothetical protein n=1 Tax=Streptomyces sp. PKU-EA00015 TaxID=2748326 RepID=UPI00159FB9C8|nr:hypothetical protein [Streptomyces sp. PKU-EA00015]NWF28010.1 hypothetical protein [Streptomyces sp. PKU-EA00015]